MPRPASKVVLIGLDGADWSVLQPLMDQGRMPVLSSLTDQGSSGELLSIEPMISPALWTTVVTGVEPEQHGIRDFVYKQPGQYAQPIVTSSVRRRLALWNILSGLGLRVGVVDWYATWPAEPVNGFIVSDRIHTLGPETEGVTHPPFASLQTTLASTLLPPLDRLPAIGALKSGFETLPHDLEKALEDDLKRYEMARKLYEAQRPDFFAFYLKGIDAVGHFYWKYYRPDANVYGEVNPRGTEQFGEVIPRYYELCDQLLGDFLGRLDDETTVVVISDHGFRAFGRPDSLIFDIDRLFSMMGLLEFEEPTEAGLRSSRKIRISATQAYAHDGTKIVSTFGERDRPVYLNVAGRDPDGLIPADALARTRSEIRSRLLELRTDLGSHVFSSVQINDDSIGPDGQQQPDLYLRVNREIAFDYDLLLDGVAHSLYDLFLWEYGDINGTHRPQGILVARGPEVRAGSVIDTARLIDVAPTLLYLAGAAVPRDFSGRVLEELFEDGSRVTGRSRLASYEGLIDVETPSSLLDPAVDEEYRERLRSLGYVQ